LGYSRNSSLTLPPRGLAGDKRCGVRVGAGVTRPFSSDACFQGVCGVCMDGGGMVEMVGFRFVWRNE
jgi:hypothetical protein